MAEYIVGFQAFRDRIKQRGDAPVELRAMALEGVEALSRYRYRIRLRGSYPQFPYWLAMPFFAPMPWRRTPSTSSPAWPSAISPCSGIRSAPGRTC